MKNIISGHYTSYKVNPLLRICGAAFLTTLIINLCSCSFSDPYPYSWNKLPAEHYYEDSAYSGNFNYYGYNSSSRDSDYSFGRLVLLPGLNDFPNCDNVVINLMGKKSLSIILRSKTDTVYKTKFPENGGEFSMTEQGPELEGLTSSGGDWGLALPIYSGKTLTLSKNTDGELIIKSETGSFGFLLIFPVWGTVTTWYKFPKYISRE
jgi:hypothetical protein